MLEDTVARVVTAKLGKYVKAIEPEALKVAITSGVVELENLEIEPAAFVDYPLAVVSGSLAKVSVRIPWKVWSTPVSMEVSGVHLRLGPKRVPDDRERLAIKRARLDELAADDALRIEAALRSKGAGAPVPETDKASDGMLDRLATKMAENLQVTLTDVKLSYIEDGELSMGVTLDSLAFTSTDEAWVPTFVENCSSTLIHKLGSLSGLSIHADVSSTPDAASVLRPLDGELKVAIVRDPASSPETPRITATLGLNSGVDLALDSAQWQALARVLATCSMYSKIARHAYHLQDNDLAADADQLAERYSALLLAGPDSAPDECEYLESALPLAVLRAARRKVAHDALVASLAAEKAAAELAASQSIVSRLFSSWWSSPSPAPADDSAHAPPPTVLTDDEMVDLLGLSSADELSALSSADDLPPSYVLLDASVKLSSLSLALTDAGDKLLDATATSLGLTASVSNSGFAFDASLGSFRVADTTANTDIVSFGDSAHAHALTCSLAKSLSADPHPLPQYSLRIRSLPCTAGISASSLGRLVAAFSVPHNALLDSIYASYAAQLKEFQRVTLAACAGRSVINLDIALQALTLALDSEVALTTTGLTVVSFAGDAKDAALAGNHPQPADVRTVVTVDATDVALSAGGANVIAPTSLALRALDLSSDILDVSSTLPELVFALPPAQAAALLAVATSYSAALASAPLPLPIAASESGETDADVDADAETKTEAEDSLEDSDQFFDAADDLEPISSSAVAPAAEPAAVSARLALHVPRLELVLEPVGTDRRLPFVVVTGVHLDYAHSADAILLNFAVPSVTVIDPCSGVALLSTPDHAEASALVELKYSVALAASPVTHSLHVAAAHLHVVLLPPPLLALHGYVRSALAPLPKAETSPDVHAAPDAALASARWTGVVDASASVNCITLDLLGEDSTAPLFSAELTSSSAAVARASSGELTASLTMGNISALDATLPLDSPYADSLITLTDTHAAQVNLSYDPASAATLVARLDIPSVRVVVLASTLTVVSSVLGKLGALRPAVENTASSLATTTMETLATQTSPSASFACHASVASPVIIIPASPTSREAVTLELGTLAVAPASGPTAYTLSLSHVVAAVYADADQPPLLLCQPFDMAASLDVAGPAPILDVRAGDVTSQLAVSDVGRAVAIVLSNLAGADPVAPARPTLSSHDVVPATSSAPDASSPPFRISLLVPRVALTLDSEPDEERPRLPILSIAFVDASLSGAGSEWSGALSTLLVSDLLETAADSPAAPLVSSHSAGDSLVSFAYTPDGLLVDISAVDFALSRLSIARLLTYLDVLTASSAAPESRAPLLDASAAVPAPQPADAASSGLGSIRVNLASFGVSLVAFDPPSGAPLPDLFEQAPRAFVHLAHLGFASSTFSLTSTNLAHHFEAHLGPLTVTDTSPWAGCHTAVCAPSSATSSATSVDVVVGMEPNAPLDISVAVAPLEITLLYRFAMDMAAYFGSFGTLLPKPASSGSAVASTTLEAVPDAPTPYRLTLDVPRAVIALPRNALSRDAIVLKLAGVSGSNAFDLDAGTDTLSISIGHAGIATIAHEAEANLVLDVATSLAFERALVPGTASCLTIGFGSGVVATLSQDQYTLVNAYSGEAMDETKASAYLQLDRAPASVGTRPPPPDKDPSLLPSLDACTPGASDADVSAATFVFGMDLPSGTVVFNALSGAGPLAHAVIDGLALRTTSRLRGDMDVSLTVQGLFLRDVREPYLRTSVHASLLAPVVPADGTNGAPQLTIAGVHHPLGAPMPGLSYTVTLDHSQTLVVPDVMRELYAFVWPIDNSPSPPHYRDTTAAWFDRPLEKRATRTLTTVLISSPQIVMPGDHTRPDSRALVLDQSLSVVYDGLGATATTRIESKSLEVFAADIDNLASSAVAILAPIDISVTVSTAPAVPTSVVVATAAYDAFVAYSDVSLMAAAAASLSAGQTAPAVSTELAAASEAKPPSPGMVLTLASQSLRVTLVNDSQGENVPLLRLDASMGGSTAGENPRINAAVALNFFNCEVSAWEPLVEKTMLRIGLRPADAQSRDGLALKLAVVSPLAVTVTAAGLGVVRLATELAALATDRSDDPNRAAASAAEPTGAGPSTPTAEALTNKRSRGSPYMVTNATGLALRLSVDGCVTELEANTASPLLLPLHTSKVRKLASSAETTMTAQLLTGPVAQALVDANYLPLVDDPNWGGVDQDLAALFAPITTLPLTSVGSHVVALQWSSSGAPSGAYLYYEVTLLPEGKFHLKFASGMVLRNDSALAWEVVAGAKATKLSFSLSRSLASGEFVAIPPLILLPHHSGLSAAVKIRPTGGYKWPKAGFKWRKIELVDETGLASHDPLLAGVVEAEGKSNTDSLIPLRANVYAEPVVSGADAFLACKVYPGHWFSISTPMAVTNALPCALEYELAPVAGQILSRAGKLGPLNSLDVHEVNVHDGAFRMRIRAGGHDWSNWTVVRLLPEDFDECDTAQIDALERIARTQFFSLPQVGALGMGDTARVSVVRFATDYDPDTRTHSVVCYAEYWFINKTPWEARFAKSGATTSKHKVLPALASGAACDAELCTPVPGVGVAEAKITFYSKSPSATTMAGKLRARRRLRRHRRRGRVAQAIRHGSAGAAPLYFSSFPLVVSIDKTNYSPAAIDVSGNIGESLLTCEERRRQASRSARYDMTLSSQVGSGLLAHTRLVVIQPRYVLVNETSASLEFTQAPASSIPLAILPPRSRAPVVWQDATIERHVFMRRADGTGWRWTRPFGLASLIDCPVKLLNYETNTMNLVRLHMVVEDKSVVVRLSHHVPIAPYRIRNQTPFALEVMESGVSHALPVAALGETGLVPEAGSGAPFELSLSWMRPNQSDLAISFPSSIFAAEGLAEVLVLHPNNILRVNVFADGPAMVLEASWRAGASMAEVSAAAADAAARAAVVTDGWAVVPRPPTTPWTVDLNILAITVSVIVPHHPRRFGAPGELFLVSLDDIEGKLEVFSDGEAAVSANIWGAQIETVEASPSHKPKFPVLLYPRCKKDRRSGRGGASSSTASSQRGELPVFSLEGTGSASSPSVRYISALMVAVAPLELRAELSSLNALSGLGRAWRPEDDVFDAAAELQALAETVGVVGPESDKDGPEGAGSGGKQLYFSFLQLPSISCSLTFAMDADLLAMVAAVERAPLSLSDLVAERLFVNPATLAALVGAHYSGEARAQALALVGSSEVLGNPLGLVADLKTGVSDAFYEPVVALRQGPEAFASGLVYGGESLVRNTVHGVFNTTSKLAASVSKGLTALSMDREYAAERQADRERNQPTGAVSGVTTGLRRFGKGLISGVTGVVTQPVKGSRKSGARGFFKGVGKGVAGLVTKPVVGALDLVDSASEGIRNAASMVAGPPAPRRLPRVVPHRLGGVLQPYSPDEAEGQLAAWRALPPQARERMAIGAEAFVASFSTNEGALAIISTSTLYILDPAPHTREIVDAYYARATSKLHPKAAGRLAYDAPLDSLLRLEVERGFLVIRIHTSVSADSLNLYFASSRELEAAVNALRAASGWAGEAGCTRRQFRFRLPNETLIKGRESDSDVMLVCDGFKRKVAAGLAAVRGYTTGAALTLPADVVEAIPTGEPLTKARPDEYPPAGTLVAVGDVLYVVAPGQNRLMAVSTSMAVDAEVRAGAVEMTPLELSAFVVQVSS
ncbi:vacuolar protein sorting-associated protein 13C [Thecamonas trahens ATCC 50062]|uniref:Vacuolar protein sorting-associated protein 13C n=1 Tax=Thecamonas trahens ATCC 50062 TaxID=461836 RepID=A0A0L0DJC5_THETB|nr:vacuolar protein sorting-associated protein 13C [Thecamonas trahens ATCC 50062]KNC52412.1 vacuolar protein sorting-associated protein 13C [Thecamonas trahens ATCC 50062]|eukprot:XP_013755455.1 vacuolar protein sorting-associated protein 13C [Thecamonas trahens ATCC 50062]